MIVAIDASRANKKERTGVEWYSYFLIQEFKKLVPADAQSEPLADLLSLPSNWEIKILRWPFRFWTIFRLSWEMLWHKPDIFFSPANILPFFTPEKTFTTIHDIGFKRFPECYSAGERWLQNFGTRRALKRLNTPLRPSSAQGSGRAQQGFAGQAIFVPSEFTKKELVEIYGVPPKKLSAIPLGCHAESSATADNSAQVVFNKYSIKKPYFLFIGRKDAKKNIAGIVEAFKIFQEKNPGHSLVLAGPSSLLLTANYLLQNVILLDWINPQEKQTLLQNCEAFLFPSLYEGFGLPILEAFAAGAPVITSNCASMPEVAGNAALLIDPKNPQEIASAMEKITKDADLKIKLIELGLEQLKKFNWETCAKQTLEQIFIS